METNSVGFECYSIGDLLLDVGTQEVSRDGTVVSVPRLSFNMLLSLARHAPNVVSVEQLEQEVWPGLVVDRGTINKRVLLLRKALAKDQDDDPYIGVVRGSGYRLVVPVEQLDASPGETGDSSLANGHETRHNLPLMRKVFYSFLGLIVALGLYQILPRGFPGPGQTQDESNKQTGVSVENNFSQNSIAVLPFVDLNDGRIHQFIGDGIAEEIINLLSGMEGLSVAARTSSFSFQNSSATIEEIARRLKVGTVVEGSIRHENGRLRVRAQLVDARSGHQIWSQNYQGAFDEVFDVQDDIALNIAQSLKLTLDEGKKLNSRKQMTGDIEAFKLYLKGRELLNDRIHLRFEGLEQALQMFSQAVEKDPKFARAHAGIATVYWLMPTYDRSVDKVAYFARAESSARFALAIDPGSIEALGALAAISSERGELVAAARFFEQVREKGSNDSDIIAWEATLHIRLGYFEELIETLMATHKLDPLNEHIAWALSDALIYSGRPSEAVVILQDLEHFSYRDYYLGLCAIYEGDYDEARNWLRDVKMRSGVLPAVYADQIISALQDHSLYEGAVDSLLFAVESDLLNNKVVFEALLMLGAPEAFSLGLDPKEDIDNNLIHAQLWNNWAVKLRRDQRFKDWVNAIGYVGFWHQFGWPDRCAPTGLDDFECI